MKPVLEGKAKSFEIQDKATDEYNNWLQRRLMNSVWTDCVSYYQAGRNSKTRIVATFPGPVTLFWWFCRHPRWEIFKANGAELWKQERKRDIWRKRVTLVITLLATMGIGYVLSSKYGSVKNVLDMVLNKIIIS
ncbi:hypothetical protein BJ165DRAFT_819164 [Panaeolus papilionaceus]|nr:hypothetical protein BJ165DRAFT_819164 [Panaeolus papilionaceus]